MLIIVRRGYHLSGNEFNYETQMSKCYLHQFLNVKPNLGFFTESSICSCFKRYINVYPLYSYPADCRIWGLLLIQLTYDFHVSNDKLNEMINNVFIFRIIVTMIFILQFIFSQGEITFMCFLLLVQESLRLPFYILVKLRRALC